MADETDIQARSMDKRSGYIASLNWTGCLALLYEQFNRPEARYSHTLDQSTRAVDKECLYRVGS